MLWSQLTALYDFQNLYSVLENCYVLENRKNSVSSKVSTFSVFFSVMHLAVHTLYNELVKNLVLTYLKKCVFTFFAPKTKHYQIATLHF